MDDRRERFANEYIKDLNGTQAAIRAGYSPKTAHVQASQLLKNVKVQERIATLKKRISDKIEFNAVDVLREMGRLAFLDMASAYNDDGSLKNIKDIPEDTRRALMSMETEEAGASLGMDNDGGLNVAKVTTRKVKFHNKRDALRDLMQYFHLLDDKPQEKDEGQLAALLAFLASNKK